MIDARDLRIGNIVFLRTFSPEGWVETQITGAHIHWIEKGEAEWKPIQITEEKLVEQMGFEKADEPMNINKSKCVLRISDNVSLESIGTFRNDGTVAVLCIFAGDYFAKNLHYIHQVQNIVRDMTGRDLPYKNGVGIDKTALNQASTMQYIIECPSCQGKINITNVYRSDAISSEAKVNCPNCSATISVGYGAYDVTAERPSAPASGE